MNDFARTNAPTRMNDSTPVNDSTPMNDPARTNDSIADSIEVYTDGACKGNPGVGGWGALLRSGEHRKELFGGEALTTNNRMELRAVIEALGSLTRPSVVSVHTDSQYVQKGISEWIAGWKRRGWKTADNKPVKNVDLWQQLEVQAARHTVKWVWVKGHAGHEGNERADQLANDGVRSVGRTGGGT